MFISALGEDNGGNAEGGALRMPAGVGMDIPGGSGLVSVFGRALGNCSAADGMEMLMGCGASFVPAERLALAALALTAATSSLGVLLLLLSFLARARKAFATLLLTV